MHFPSLLLSLDNFVLNPGTLVDKAEGIRSLIYLADTMNSRNCLQFTIKLVIRLHQDQIRCSGKLQTSSDESRCAYEDLEVVLLLSKPGVFVDGVGEGVEHCGALPRFHACTDETYSVLLVSWKDEPLDELSFC